ncbi:MAG: tRNA uridine-5-carboxymethylaminomethyl(34) synthesis GTPase MnmE [Proteobacteria bacterium]|nr:tRNA uridine-5-carboxymethylaminomethyl(34) synthesis GTPase MnmE [Pseudomonadota bacterium]
MTETIYALASALGRAGVAVYRISGPEAGFAVTSITGFALPKPRRALRVVVSDPDTGEQIDNGLVVWFPGPRSYTGDDVAEFHLHGGSAIQQRFLDLLGRQKGLRMAEPGEFTRRAVLAGKLDLTEAEGLIDLIDAETEAQRRQALMQAQGALGRLYNSWRDRLVPCLAHLEAAIDFPDEDLPPEAEAVIWPTVRTLIGEISTHLEDDRRGERLRDGLRIAIIGPPNVGKSSLLNWLAQRDAAIVSAIAGTTRDVIEVHLDLGGFPVVLADTAGIREARSEIESIGVSRAFDRAGTSDLKILVLAADDMAAVQVVEDIIDSDTIIVLNKIDVRAEGAEGAATQISERCAGLFFVSVKNEVGLDKMVLGILDAVSTRISSGNAPAITRQRHREALHICLDALRRSNEAKDVELGAEDLRIAVRSFGSLTGLVDVEDLLDIIFRDFCIGK